MNEMLWVRDNSPLPEEPILLPFPHARTAKAVWFKPLGPHTLHPREMIVEWQRRLRKWKYGSSTLPVMVYPSDGHGMFSMLVGIYCEGTVNNTKHFQNKMGLEQTGVVDLPTDLAMLEYLQQ